MVLPRDPVLRRRRIEPPRQRLHRLDLRLAQQTPNLQVRQVRLEHLDQVGHVRAQREVPVAAVERRDQILSQHPVDDEQLREGPQLVPRLVTPPEQRALPSSVTPVTTSFTDGEVQSLRQAGQHVDDRRREARKPSEPIDVRTEKGGRFEPQSNRPLHPRVVTHDVPVRHREDRRKMHLERAACIVDQVVGNAGCIHVGNFHCDCPRCGRCHRCEAYPQEPCGPDTTGLFRESPSRSVRMVRRVRNPDARRTPDGRQM